MRACVWSGAVSGHTFRNPGRSQWSCVWDMFRMDWATPPQSPMAIVRKNSCEMSLENRRVCGGYTQAYVESALRQLHVKTPRPPRVASYLWAATDDARKPLAPIANGGGSYP